MKHAIDELKTAARGGENTKRGISKTAALAAVSAFRSLERIAAIPVGRNPQAEAQRMREIASAAVKHDPD